MSIVERAEQVQKDLGIALGKEEEGTVAHSIIQEELDDVAEVIALVKATEMDSIERDGRLRGIASTTTSGPILEIIEDFKGGL